MTGSSGFRELGDGVFAARYHPFDVTVGLVVGDTAALVIDTRAGARQGQRLGEDLVPLLGGRPVRHVVNTHVHVDHTFGNSAFATATVHAHRNAVAAFERECARARDLVRADPSWATGFGASTDDIQDLLTTHVPVPDAAVDGVGSVDLGGRVVTMWHPGRAHTDGDLVVQVSGSPVVFVGDLVEESGPPAFGDDSFPLDWAGTLGAVLAGTPDDAILVPGHGAVVDAGFAQAQQAAIGSVAAVIRSRHASGMSLAEAQVRPTPSPAYPVAQLADAFSRGWWQLDGLMEPPRAAWSTAPTSPRQSSGDSTVAGGGPPAEQARGGTAQSAGPPGLRCGHARADR